MRRISVFVASIATSFVMALSGLAFCPAHASSLDDGNYLCSTGVITTTMGPTYTITADVVSAGTSCAGNVVIPEGVKGIKDHGFSGAGDITSISFADDGMLTYIGAFAFEWNIHLKKILIPASVTTIGLAAFYGGLSLTSLFFLGDDPAPNGDIFWASQLGGYESATKAYFRTGATGFASDIDGKWNGVPISPFYKLTFDGTDSESGSAPRQIFSGAGEIITIPGNPWGLKRAGYNFAGWTDGDGNPYPAGLVGPMPAFDGTLLAAWTPSNSNVLVDGKYACGDGTYTITTVGSDVTVSNGSTCTGALVIPEGVTAISASAFDTAIGLRTITIPASVTDVGAFAFDGTSLNSITFGVNSQLTSIGAYAFYGQTALTSLAIPASVTSIGLGAFQGAVSLNSITFGVNSQLTSIGVAAFSESTITSITIPASVNSIGDSAFQGANSLSSIYFLGSAPNSVGLSVFGNIGASPKAHVNSASASTFTLDGAGLWNGLTVASYDHLVTYNSNGGSPVSAVGFTTGGTLSAPNAPTRDGYGFAGWSRTDGGAAVVFPYSPGGTSDVTLFSKWLVDGSYLCSTGLSTTPQLPPPSAINTYPITNGIVVTNHSANGSNNCAGAVVIPEGVTSIGDFAFGFSNFPTSITVPASVTSIGLYAFYGATSLEDVTFATDSRLTVINNFAFNEATSLTSITIPGSVTSIGGSAFGNASKLSNIYFLGNAPTVGEGAFTDIGEAPKAYVKNANVSSFTPLVDGKWNGLTLVIVDPPVVDPPVVDPPVVPPVVPPSGITSDTAADLAAAKLAAGKLAAADLAARTVGKKKTFVAKTLAKRVGIKTVSSKATVTMSVSKSSKKICVVSKSKLMTLKVGKCLVTFTVQEPKPKKGKLPKATKTTKTLVVN